MMCGLAFSGKTTLARHIVRRQGAEYVGLDEINAERGLIPGDEPIPVEEWQRSSVVAAERIEEMMAAGRSVVLDDTCCFRQLRDGYREVARRSGGRAQLILIDVDPSEVRARIARNADTGNRAAFSIEMYELHISEFERPGSDEEFLAYAGEDPDVWIDRHLR